jgi:hypothetical protein
VGNKWKMRDYSGNRCEEVFAMKKLTSLLMRRAGIAVGSSKGAWRILLSGQV